MPFYKTPPVNAILSNSAATLSDLAVDDNTLTIDETNNRVGIGTATPSGTLGIDGDLYFQPTAISTSHVYTAGSLDIRCQNNLKIGTDGADSIRIGRTNTALAKIYVRSGADNDLVVTDSKVGIGTDSPSTALEVAGVVTSTGLTIGSAAITETELEILDGATLSTTELNYVDGVTSAIQTQIDGKQATDADLTALSSCQSGGAAALAALTSTEIGILDGATLSTTELNYVDGVTSAIHTQLDSKGATAGSNSIVSVGTVSAGTWEGTAIASAYLDADTAHLSGSQVFSGEKTFTGGAILANSALMEGSGITMLAPTLPSTDHTSTGLSAQMLAGGAIAAFQTVCIHTTANEVVVSDADAIGTMPVIGIAPAAISDTATGTILLQGFIRDDTWTWTAGGIVYASGTAGAMTQTAPSGSGDFVQALGIALSADVVYFNPSLTLVEVA